MRSSIPSLLSTKLQLPVSAHPLLTRTRLLDMLDVGTQNTLTLVTGPAGYGKTTLLAQWAMTHCHERSSIAWVTLERDDNNPLLFWRYLTTALNQCKTGICEQLVQLSSSDTQNTEQYQEYPMLPSSIQDVLISLINVLAAAPHDIVLILDDYQCITEASIHRQMLYFLNHLPPHIHLVLVSRTRISLPLARLRATSHIVEIETQHLRATEDETMAFLMEILHLSFSPQLVPEIVALTEGWFAGIYLLSLEWGTHASPGSSIERLPDIFYPSRYILEYVLEEVIHPLPDNVQHFLLHTAPLLHCSASLCDAVLQRTDGQQFLDRLLYDNIFLTPVEGLAGWYRYHPLFAQVLRAHLERLAPDKIPTIEARATQWYEQHREYSYYETSITSSRMSPSSKQASAISPRLHNTVQRPVTPILTSTQSRQSTQVARYSPHEHILLDPLSIRELDVLSLMAQGASNQDIAEQLVISVVTVKTHVSNILSKLGASNRTHAVIMAQAMHYLPDASQRNIATEPLRGVS